MPGGARRRVVWTRTAGWSRVAGTMFDEMVDEDTRAELLDGVMMVHSPATVQHDHVSGFLRALMSFYAEP